ncbi:hypothetical protein [Nonlabens ulvanivorans]|uniref:Uncharacterized protein n=2 Tax=Nonlabens ulvanivorans TaxID=906888 RepID=A0ABX5E3R6_NONUL|nr:hypothetical protein [Nonlabens ulvanivorans]PRX13591.1 hypothetical protein LY02_01835 [Nonlabens ulvanivorans]
MINFIRNFYIMFYSTTSTDLQFLLMSSTDWMTLLVISSVIALGTFVVYRLYDEDADKAKKSVMIKIDRNGKHRYEIKENLDNGKVYFWMKLIFFIIALGLLFIPIHSWFYKS